MPDPVNKRAELLGFPRSYAFVIGINDYPLINRNLASAVGDARAIARALKYQQGFDHVELLLAPVPDANDPGKNARLAADMDGIELRLDASGATIRDLMARIRDPQQEPKISAGDCIVFYYAGHGKAGEFGAGPAGYLLPSDARPQKAELENSSLIAMEDVFETLKTLDCHHTLLILDCCFAGKFRHVGAQTRASGWVSHAPLYEERFQRYRRERAWQVLVSAGPHQTAADWVGDRLDAGEQSHSPFAGALIKALKGEVKTDLNQQGRNLGDGVLTSQELFLYLWETVEQLTNAGQHDQDIQYPDLFPMSSHQGGQFIFFDPNNKLNFAQRELRNPYKGLSPFEVEDSDLFFGRKDVVKRLLGKIRQTELLVITGPSASGKSSLVKAGLFPALRSGTQSEWADGELLVLQPGAKPWSGEPVADDDTQAVRHYTGLASLLPVLDAQKKQLLLIDQYEQLFTAGAAGEERMQFEEHLIRLYRAAPDNQVKIVLTLRSDFEWLLEDSRLGQVIWQEKPLAEFLYRIPPMGMEDLQQALMSPALAELYDFETDELPAIILAEIGYAPGALPMLSFTMSRFYDITDRDKRMFTLPDYRKMGGVNGALSQFADEVFAELGGKSEAHRTTMRQLLLRMVQLDEGGYSRRRVYVAPNGQFEQRRDYGFLNEFDYPNQHDDVVAEVLQILEQKQLVLGGNDLVGLYYEPVHDSLIQHWKTAKQWIADFGAENLRLQRHLWQAVLDAAKAESALSGPPSLAIGYGATEADQLGTDPSLTDNFSTLWDANPDLMLVLQQISKAATAYFLAEKDALLAEALPTVAAVDRENFQAFWSDCHGKGAIPDLNTLILSGYSDKLLAIFLDKGNHWLNEAECEFVRRSWAKRIADIMDLKRQRDEAVVAKKRAEQLLQKMALQTNSFKSKFQEQARKEYQIIKDGYKPSLHLVLVGIDNYDSSPLRGCVNDVHSLEEAFRSQEGKLYEKVSMHTLVDEHASKKNILAEVNEAKNVAGIFDFVILYFAGHGEALQSSHDGIFIPYQPMRAFDRSDDECFISGHELCSQLMRFDAKVILILDIGGGGGDFLNTLVNANRAEDVNQMTHNVFGLSATSPGQHAQEVSIEGKSRGVFSWALTNSFRSNDADLDSNGVVYLDELLLYTSRMVEEKVREQNVYAVIPATMSNIPLFQLGDDFAAPDKEMVLSGHIEDDTVIESIMAQHPELDELRNEFNSDYVGMLDRLNSGTT